MHLKSLWPHVAHMFADVLSRPGSGWTIDSMVKHVLDESWQLWMVWTGSRAVALCATELGVCDDGSKICNVLFCTGEDAKSFLPILRPIEAWARDEGCTSMKARTRKGWAKHLQDYTMTHVYLEKVL